MAVRFGPDARKVLFKNILIVLILHALLISLFLISRILLPRAIFANVFLDAGGVFSYLNAYLVFVFISLLWIFFDYACAQSLTYEFLGDHFKMYHLFSPRPVRISYENICNVEVFSGNFFQRLFEIGTIHIRTRTGISRDFKIRDIGDFTSKKKRIKKILHSYMVSQQSSYNEQFRINNLFEMKKYK